MTPALGGLLARLFLGRFRFRRFAFRRFAFLLLFLLSLDTRLFHLTLELVLALADAFLVFCGTVDLGNLVEKRRRRLRVVWRESGAALLDRNATGCGFDVGASRIHLVVGSRCNRRLLAGRDIERLVIGAADPDCRVVRLDCVVLGLILANPSGDRAQGARDERQDTPVPFVAIGT